MEHLLTIPQCMERLHVSRQTVYKLLGTGELPSVKIGKARRVKASELDALIDRMSTDTLGGAA